MTLNEFKAWLEGYEASFADGVPDAKQYAEIKRRLSLAMSLAPVPDRQWKVQYQDHLHLVGSSAGDVGKIAFPAKQRGFGVS